MKIKLGNMEDTTLFLVFFFPGLPGLRTVQRRMAERSTASTVANGGNSLRQHGGHAEAVGAAL
jgi:hypothetical protein